MHARKAGKHSNQLVRLVFLIFLSVFVCIHPWFQSAFAQAPQYSLVIRNGSIIDGSGNPWYVADVGIREGRIVALGRLCSATTPGCAAKQVLDAKGLVVAPGFIDVHTHVEGSIRRIPTADNLLFDGVTSIITGNCGGSETDLEKFFGELRGRLSINLGTLIGHNSVRREVMGSEQRDPTPEEQARMEALVERAMQQGAVGFSTGLIYIPGTYSKTPEVVALARAAAKYNGVYASHMRSEGEKLFDAITEALHIGREAGMPVEISHFKVSNKKMWNQSTRSIEMVERARAEGLDVTVDQYPYTASSTNLGTLLPSWALAGGQEKIKERLSDPATRKRIATEMRDTIQKRNGRKRLDYAFVARYQPEPSWEGKSITQINKLRGRKSNLPNEIETVLEMMERGGAGMVYHSMDERDVERILRYPYSMVASDGGVQEMGRGVPHPRSYGTNARVLARYVRERGTIRLEEAVRKMTSLPAQRFRLVDRGLIRPGMWADIVVFDPRTVRDTATFEKPHSNSEGFTFVLVNGEIVIESGKHTGARPGQILLGPGVAGNQLQ
jgi:N-acyl-D-amino-acid deacylase